MRQPDGSWVFDMDNPTTKREAEKSAQFNRIMGDIQCQVWPEAEAAAIRGEMNV
jgi:hypothetical protein